jgi:hypothetical protein
MVDLQLLAHCENPVFYTTELVNSYFHLWESGYHHDRVDVDALAAGTVDEDPIALYYTTTEALRIWS